MADKYYIITAPNERWSFFFINNDGEYMWTTKKEKATKIKSKDIDAILKLLKEPVEVIGL